MHDHNSDVLAGTAPAGGNRLGSGAVPEVADHKLVACVGRGAYGEVWLACNVVGCWRAVKVVYRRAFEHERPYEREFEGIRKFEPVSRTHPSQLNVLQIGRSDSGGYFYYVMELADDAHAPTGLREGETRRVARELNPETYLPHTLKLELCRKGRLPFAECLNVGLALTTALEHLHENGLVHRDIKPSNIIFVKGVPKLADIGLVATKDATMSFVGTSGFVPPEGPGTPQGDLYGLGKVLYEMAMGRDRQEFPKLPGDIAESEQAVQLLELNAVILKACQNDPRLRYHSARELATDLLLLQRGQSVRRLRTVERRLALATRAAVAAGAMLLLAAALYWNAARQERATARQLYAADMNRAQQAWDGGNVTLARELLDAHRRRQPEMLGFEWRLLARLCQQSEARFTLHGHTGIVWSVAFSPDGATLATCSSDNTVKLWDSASGRLRDTLHGHTRIVHAVAFSPDGRLLASGGRDFTVKLWDPRTGDDVATLGRHTAPVRSVAFSPDGQWLASGGEDKTLRWWSVTATQEVARVATGFNVEKVAYSPDGEVLGACGADNRVHLWNNTTREEEPGLGMHQAQLLCLAFAADGRTLATGSFDGTIRLWDLVRHCELGVLGRGAPVRCVAFASGGKFLAAATEDGLVRLWDVSRREVVSTLRGHAANVRALAFSPKGDLLGTGDEDSVAKLWDIAPRPGHENALAHTGIVNNLAFSPNGRALVSTDSATNMLRLWDIESQQLNVVVAGENRSIWCVAFAADGIELATGGIDGTVRFRNATNLSERLVLRAHKEGIDSVAFSPDGRRLVSGSRDCTAKVWERATGRELATLPSAGGIVRAVAFSPNGKILAAGCGPRHVLLWNADSLHPVASLAGHQGEVRAVAFSPDGRMLASGGADRVIIVWDVRARKALRTTLAGHAAMISSLAFSADGRTLVSGSWDSTIRLWNLRLSREVATLRAHSSQVTQVGFSPDGNTLASSSGDGTVRLWAGVPDTRQELTPGITDAGGRTAPTP